MAIALYSSDLVDIFLFESVTGVSAYGGGAGGLGAGVDFAMEGTNAVDKQITASEKGFLYDSGANFTIGANDHFFEWIMGATPGINDTRDNRGIVMCIGDSTSAFVKFHMDGVDTLPLGGGQVYVVRFDNTALAGFRTLVGSPGATPSQIGGGLNTTAAAKAPNLGVDGARIGTGYDITGGTGADPAATFAGVAADDESTSEGVLQTADGGYKLQGKLRIGSAASACELTESNKLISIRDTRHALPDFTEILLENAASILTLENITFLALGTNNRGRLEVITGAASALLTSCVFDGFGETVLGTGSVLVNCNWRGAGVIAANGANISGATVSGFEGVVDSSAIIWGTATDPDGFLDDVSISKGVAATHAVEFGASSPLNMTIRGMNASGYNAANGQLDSTFHIKRTTGTVTINIVGGAGNFTYKTDGATVVIQNTVVATITVDFNGVTPANYEWRLYEKDATDGIIGTVELDGVEAETGLSVTYAYSYVSNVSVVFQVIASGYQESLTYFTLVNSNTNITSNVISESNI